MQIDFIEYTDVLYKCNCDGYKKEKELENEIDHLKHALSNKQIELEEHINNSYLHRAIGLKEKEIRDLKIKYDE